MNLKYLLDSCDGVQKIKSDAITIDQIEIKNIVFDSRKANEKCLFVAVKGHSQDGHDHIEDAINNGADVVVVEKIDGVPSSFSGAVVLVRSTRKALSDLARAYFGNPQEQIKLVGVTGTNGKTTTAYLVEQLINELGGKTGVLGTINHHLGDKVWESQLTTPDPVALFGRFKEMIDVGADTVVMEVSSHALSQGRVDNIGFDVTVFTNLTQDHLDYHQTMDKYFKAKSLLFIEPSVRKSSSVAIINTDDIYGEKLFSQADTSKLSFGFTDQDLSATDVRLSVKGASFDIGYKDQHVSVMSPLIGKHNVYNVLASIGVCLALGFDLKKIANAVSTLSGAPGRLQKIANSKGLNVFVDYAHTPDALAQVLSGLEALKEENSKIITVFGCGGDRDKSKRPLMAKAALAGSDECVVTSDNPRNESPSKIIDDILSGVSDECRGKVKSVVLRAEAIEQALKMAKAGDIVLVAGKGHEDYQIIGNQSRPFSDVEVVKGTLG